MRYLSRDAKAAELVSWETAKADYLAHPPKGFVGGHGYPDPEMFSWCDKLNAIDGVCTLQSCAGHRCDLKTWVDGERNACSYCKSKWASGGTPDEHVWSGQLWLWLDAISSRMFHANALTLAAHPLIEKVSVIYHVEGKEIVDIVFKGAGTHQLDESMEALVQFFSVTTGVCEICGAATPSKRTLRD